LDRRAAISTGYQLLGVGRPGLERRLTPDDLARLPGPTVGRMLCKPSKGCVQEMPIAGLSIQDPRERQWTREKPPIRRKKFEHPKSDFHFAEYRTVP
jgi:hypothetical protein